MTEITLKPCPFCGGEAHFGKTSYSKPLEDTVWHDDGAPVTEAHFVSCVSCTASNRNSLAGGCRTQERAAESWNTRQAEAKVEGLLREARGYVCDSHDEGCECDPEYGEAIFERRMEEEDPSGETTDTWPDYAECTCGVAELLNKIDAHLSHNPHADEGAE